MLRVFGKTDKTYISNGDVVLSRAFKAKVHKADNAEYYLDLETSLDYVNFILEGNIVVASTPQGEQAFRINNVTKTKTKISAKCPHVFYDSKNYLIADNYVQDKTCAEALAYLNAHTDTLSEFTTESDVDTVASFRCVRKSLYEAVEVILERWGGHLVRDNFNIAIKESIGQDNGVIIQYRKNLKDISASEDWSNVCTKLLPVGKDGILLNAVDPTADIYVTSSTQYSLPYTKAVNFSQEDINEEDYPDEETYKSALVSDLQTQAEKYLSDYALPKVNYTLKANVDYISDIGDTIEVIDERLGLDLMTTVISFEYDCILEKYTEVEFGNFKKSISGLGGKIDGIESVVTIQGEKVTSLDYTVTEQKESLSELSETVDGHTESINSIDLTLEDVAGEIIRMENHITGSLTSDFTYNNAGVVTKIPLDSSNAFGSLITFVSGSVKIGEGIEKVKVSAHANINGLATDGERVLLLCKNDISTILATASMSMDLDTYCSISLTPMLINVEKDDLLFIAFSSGESTDIVKTSTYLTVEAV